jgi:hypothetical protein
MSPWSLIARSDEPPHSPLWGDAAAGSDVLAAGGGGGQHRQPAAARVCPPPGRWAAAVWQEQHLSAARPGASMLIVLRRLCLQG